MKSEKIFRNRTTIGILVFMAIMPFIIRQNYPLFVMNTIVINAILVLALNFILGFAGQVFMGTVGFFAVSTYVAALFLTKLKVSWWLAMLAAVLASMVLSLIVGLPSLRVSGFNLSIMSTGFILVVIDVLRNWSSLTGGVFGIMAIPRPIIFGLKLTDNMYMYFLTFAVLAVLTWFAIRIEDSRFGLSFKSVRDDELATELIGISSTGAKMLAFTISGLYTGIAGALFGSLHGFISPEVFSAAFNSLFMCMLVVGGLSSIPGGMAGAIVLSTLTEFLRPLRERYLAAYGLLILLILRYEPGGFIQIVTNQMNKAKRRKPAPTQVGGVAK